MRRRRKRVSEAEAMTRREPDRSKIARGLAWAARTPAAETDLDALFAQAVEARPDRRRRKR